MEMKQPKRFSLDVVSDSGTPFRFVFWPGEGAVRYYDRRHMFTEDGQACGPALDYDDVMIRGRQGIHAWHDVEEWDVDASTMELVRGWLMINVARSVEQKEG